MFYLLNERYKILKFYLRDVFSKEINVIPRVQIIRFIINGLVSAAGDVSILVFLTGYCGVHYLISAAIGVIFGITINYFISIVWVFVSGKFSNQTLEYLLFFLFSFLGLAINQVVMFICVSMFFIHYLLAKFFALVIVSTFNFFTKKYVVFAK